MRSLTPLRVCSFSALSLLLAACSIIPLSPSLDLTVKSTAYTTSKVDIPYTFATLSPDSNDGSAQCSYTLEKWDAIAGNYQWVTGQQETLASRGTLSFPLATLRGVNSGSPQVDGLYRLSFSVLSGRYDQAGNPEAIPYLSKSVSFTVYTVQGPEILSISPPIVNVNNSSQTFTVEGMGFTSSDTVVTQPVSPTIVTSSSIGSAQTATVTINATSLTPGNQLGLYIQESGGALSPSYYFPIVNNVAISSVVPNSGSATDSRLPLYITGSFLGGWTSVTVTGANGTTTHMAIDSVGGNYIFGYLDLTSLSVGAATLTVDNPDGSSASVSFAVFN